MLSAVQVKAAQSEASNGKKAGKRVGQVNKTAALAAKSVKNPFVL